MKERGAKIIMAVALLFVGGCIYLFYRTRELSMFRWVSALGLDGIVEGIRNIVSDLQLPSFVKYCLPNGLWLASYILITDALVEKNKLFWAMVLPVIALSFEALQILRIIPGTFDWGDIVCLLIPTILYAIYYLTHYEKRT